MRVIGIDPGLSGGICVVEMRGKTPVILDLIPMPIIKGKSKTLDLLSIFSFLGKWKTLDTKVSIEDQFILARQGMKANKTIYENMGMLKAACILNDLEYSLFKPKEWQAKVPSYPVPLILSKWTFEHTKVRSISAAMHIFPSVNLVPTSRSTKPSDGLADCLLIALHLLML